MRLVEGTIATVPNGDDEVMVVIGEFSVDQLIGPCPYMPRGASAPAVDDRCLVAFDPAGSWVVAYTA